MKALLLRSVFPSQTASLMKVNVQPMFIPDPLSKRQIIVETIQLRKDNWLVCCWLPKCRIKLKQAKKSMLCLLNGVYVCVCDSC